MGKWTPVASLAANASKQNAHFLFANPWKWNDGVMEKIAPRLPSGGWRADSGYFSACASATHPKVDRSELSAKRFEREKELGLKVMGSYLVFDPAGTLRHAGALTPAEVDEWIAKCQTVTPVLVDTGAEPYEQLAKLAAEVRAGKKLGKALATCEKTIADDAADAARKGEARRLRDAIRWWAQEKERSALDALGRDPSLTAPRYKALAKALSGSDLGKQVAQRGKQLDRAGEVKAAMALAAIVGQIRKIPGCSTCGGKLRCKWIALTCTKCRTQRADDIARVLPQVKAWLGRFGEAHVADQARRLATQLDPSYAPPDPLGRNKK